MTPTTYALVLLLQRQAESQELTPGTAVTVGLAERPVLVAPAEPAG